MLLLQGTAHRQHNSNTVSEFLDSLRVDVAKCILIVEEEMREGGMGTYLTLCFIRDFIFMYN